MAPSKEHPSFLAPDIAESLDTVESPYAGERTGTSEDMDRGAWLPLPAFLVVDIIWRAEKADSTSPMETPGNSLQDVLRSPSASLTGWDMKADKCCPVSVVTSVCASPSLLPPRSSPVLSLLIQTHLLHALGG